LDLQHSSKHFIEDKETTGNKGARE
jgi:hypothetical protein